MAYGPTAVTPLRGDQVVGAEPRPGGRRWTIPKSTYENQVGTLPMRVGSGCCGGGVAHSAVRPLGAHRECNNFLYFPASVH